MNIRLARDKDKKGIIDLLEQLSRFFDQQDIPRPDKIFDEVLTRDDIKLFVAEEKGKILGVASFYILPCIRHNYYRGHIEELVVEEAYRGQGVGTKLLETIKSYCKEKKISVFKVETGVDNKQAQHFYEKNGGVSKRMSYKFKVE